MNEFLDTHWIDPERFLGYNKIVYGPDLDGERMPGTLLQGVPVGFPDRSF